MANLKDLVKEVILGDCKIKEDWPLDFSTTRPLFILIKDNEVSLSKDMDSLEEADECMFFYSYYRDNTVPDRYKQGQYVTFRNERKGFRYIDSKGEPSYWYFDNGFEIVGFDDYTCRLKYNDIELMRVSVTEENIKDLWNCYLTAKKCLQIKIAELESTKTELEKKLELLTSDYNILSQRHEKVIDSIREIINDSESKDQQVGGDLWNE